MGRFPVEIRTDGEHFATSTDPRPKDSIESTKANMVGTINSPSS